MVPPAEPPRKVLVIDDDAFILSALKLLLELEGCEVVAARGFAAGIAAFLASHRDESPIALVFTDLAMPYREGFEVARTVKSRAPQVPVVLLSGCIEDLATQPDAVHVDVVMQKPPMRSELRQVLRRLGTELAPQ